MDVAGLTIGANVVSALLGRQIMSQAISDASGTIYTSIGDIFYYSNSVDKVLCELDIGNKIKTMELLTKEFSTVKEINNEDAINYCLENLHDMIIRIREDIKQISAKIKDHKKKYLNNWRTVDVKNQIYNLKIHTHLLDKRYDLLVKTINVTNVLRNNNNYLV